MQHGAGHLTPLWASVASALEKVQPLHLVAPGGFDCIHGGDKSAHCKKLNAYEMLLLFNIFIGGS